MIKTLREAGKPASHTQLHAAFYLELYIIRNQGYNSGFTTQHLVALLLNIFSVNGHIVIPFTNVDVARFDTSFFKLALNFFIGILVIFVEGYTYFTSKMSEAKHIIECDTINCYYHISLSISTLEQMERAFVFITQNSNSSDSSSSQGIQQSQSQAASQIVV